DALQVLLRGLELQLRRAAPRLVFRHAGRFLDQLPAIRRTGAQDLADLPLLDHRIRLDAETRVHQQVLHVFQAHDLAVDQVFAFPRAIEPPRQLDVADDRRILVEDRLLLRHLDDELAGRLPVPRHARRDARQPQAHLRRRRRLPPVAPLEDDVLHVLAAQALRALLAEHPGDRVDDVALPAAVGADDRGDAGVEGKLRSLGKALEAGDFEAVQAHMKVVAARTQDGPFRSGDIPLLGSGWVRFDEQVVLETTTGQRPFDAVSRHPANRDGPSGPANGGQSNNAPYLG